ncbi:hypothetical protein BD779DRAFT_1539141 [Infundibulicybe gibba]|nr:hypothetical protein BD779DRAFT_1539141 [Infundibulicybe gibba]
MPATRATGRHPQPRGSKSPRFSPSLEEDELLLVSSGSTMVSGALSKAACGTKSRPKAIIKAIEILSDDGSVPPCVSTSTAVGLQCQNAELQKKNKCSEEALARCQQELLELHRTAESKNSTKGKLVLDESVIEDHLCCEVCMNEMWVPYLLPDCGHTFCQTCLQDWFDSILVQHITTHPHYDLNQPNVLLMPQITAALRGMPSARDPQIQHLLMQLNSQHPQYTCPTCCKPVHGRPVENFALKALVQIITSVRGESSPEKAANPKGKGVTRRNEPWSGFFPQLSD